MNIDEIKELLRIFNESGVGELELQRGRDRLRIRRAGEPAAPLSAAPIIHEAVHVAPEPAASWAPPPAGSAPKPAEPAAGQAMVKSPIVGTFYDAPSPGAPPFVKVGDSVTAGQVLCIIESMKLMNEIEAEVGGVIASKLVENGRPV
jgi:acetyl-CoA carboxylase biotin carboxyl carrier protein